MPKLITPAPGTAPTHSRAHCIVHGANVYWVPAPYQAVGKVPEAQNGGCALCAGGLPFNVAHKQMPYVRTVNYVK